MGLEPTIFAKQTGKQRLTIRPRYRDLTSFEYKIYNVTVSTAFVILITF